MNKANINNEGQYIVSALSPPITHNNLCDQKIAEEEVECSDADVVEIGGSHYLRSEIRCDLCNMKIGSDRYVVHDDHIFDDSCFRYLYAPRCFVCCGLLSESAIRWRSNFYHSECFYCIKCLKPITTTETHMNVSGFPVCKHCYQQTQNVCIRCLRTVDKRNSLEFFFQGKAYHTHCDHAICSTCGMELRPDNFAVLENSSICTKCWYLAMKNQCNKCRKPILSSDLLKYHGKWHSECFRCFRCNADVTNCNGILIDNDQIFCSNCRKAAIKTHCAICMKLAEKDYAEKNGYVIHQSCMFCNICKRNLTQSDDSVLEKGVLYCCNCFQNNMNT